jgi:hypothetical protein
LLDWSLEVPLAPKVRESTVARRAMKSFFGLDEEFLWVGWDINNNAKNCGREETCTTTRHKVCLPREASRFLAFFDVNARDGRPGSGANHIFVRSGGGRRLS